MEEKYKNRIKTEHKRLPNELSYTLNSINEIFLSSLESEDILDQVLAKAAKAIRCESAQLSLLINGQWEISSCYGFSGDAARSILNDKQQKHAMAAINARKPVIINDTGSVMIIPLLTDKQAIGVIFFNYHTRIKAFRQPFVDFVSSLAIPVAFIIERIRLFKNIELELKQHKQIGEHLLKEDCQKNEFIAMMSHELRNPLAAIESSLEVLDLTSSNDELQRQAKSTLKRQVGLLTRMVDELLDITRITQNKIELKYKKFDLNELILYSFQDYKPIFESNSVDIKFESSPSTICINGDEARIAQVVGNLLMNAVKFTERGGSTVISVRPNDRNQAVISVKDTGMGMTQETISQIFQPFIQADNTLDRTRGGVGLGLSLVRRLVEMHGGCVDVRSDGLGKGSEFIVYLPLAEAPVQEMQAINQEDTHTCRRILIIEDNTDLAYIMRDLLDLKSHETMIALNGPEGLQKAKEFHPEVLLCDIGLPGMSGYEVAKAFRTDEALKDIYLIALTGYAQPSDIQKAFDAGFDEHLAKPVGIDVLEKALSRANRIDNPDRCNVL